jgi:hypothetical protein
LTKLVIKGTGEEARAALQADFDARNAAFEANLSAILKSASQATVTEVPTKPPVVTGWTPEMERARQLKR